MYVLHNNINNNFEKKNTRMRWCNMKTDSFSILNRKTFPLGDVAGCDDEAATLTT